jgi:hypothetical protein
MVARRARRQGSTIRSPAIARRIADDSSAAGASLSRNPAAPQVIARRRWPGRPKVVRIRTRNTWAARRPARSAPAGRWRRASRCPAARRRVRRLAPRRAPRRRGLPAPTTSKSSSRSSMLAIASLTMTWSSAIRIAIMLRDRARARLPTAGSRLRVLARPRQMLAVSVVRPLLTMTSVTGVDPRPAGPLALTHPANATCDHGVGQRQPPAGLSKRSQAGDGRKTSRRAGTFGPVALIPNRASHTSTSAHRTRAGRATGHAAPEKGVLEDIVVGCSTVPARTHVRTNQPPKSCLPTTDGAAGGGPCTTQRRPWSLQHRSIFRPFGAPTRYDWPERN